MLSGPARAPGDTARAGVGTLPAGRPPIFAARAASSGEPLPDLLELVEGSPGPRDGETSAEVVEDLAELIELLGKPLLDLVGHLGRRAPDLAGVGDDLFDRLLNR